MWKCGNTRSLLVLISRAAWPFLLYSALDLLLLGLLGLQQTKRIFNYLSFFIYRCNPLVLRMGELKRLYLFGGHSESVTPVPIPHTEVKPLSADGTAREAWWESRSPPIHFL